jgi:hypothetical protein
MKCRIANAAQLALEAVRHQDLLGKPPTASLPPLHLTFIRVIELKFPRAVQRLPIGSHHVGTRVLWTRNISGQQAMSEKDRKNSLESNAVEDSGHRRHRGSSPLRENFMNRWRFRKPASTLVKLDTVDGCDRD